MVLWEGVFNFRCEQFHLYRYAVSKKQARVRMCREIARKHGVNEGLVTAYFPDMEGTASNYEIKEVQP